MEGSTWKGIWVFAEREEGRINPAVFEVLGKARKLKETDGQTISALLLGTELRPMAAELIAAGADRVILLENPALAEYSPRVYQKALSALAQKHRPDIILFPATALGRELAPRLMVSLKTGLTADAVDLEYDGEGSFCQTTPAYGGSLMAHICIPQAKPQMATVRTGLFPAPAPDYSRQGEIVEEHMELEEDGAYRLLSRERKENAQIPIDKAQLIVSGGRGVKDEEALRPLHELTQALGGQLAASRPLVDAGLLPHERQIGQSGATVKPELIINAGISGSVQYQIGMKGAGCILSINKDPSAPIFDISDYGAAADLNAVIPALIREIQRRREERK